MGIAADEEIIPRWPPVLTYFPIMTVIHSVAWELTHTSN